MLEVRELDFAYGQAQALSGVSLTLAPGEIVCLLGMNGAGKTTLLSCLSGIAKPKAGTILLDGAPTPKKPAKIVAAGVVQVPEGRRVFAPLTVRENLDMGAYVRLKAGRSREVAESLALVLDLFPELGKRLNERAGNLSGGQQQMLALGRGLMAGPKYLLLDEPSLGISPKLTAAIFRALKRLPQLGTGVLLVEQNALAALAVADRGYILTRGRIRFSGRASEILSDAMLREAFLGPGDAVAGPQP